MTIIARQNYPELSACGGEGGGGGCGGGDSGGMGGGERGDEVKNGFNK